MPKSTPGERLDALLGARSLSEPVAAARPAAVPRQMYESWVHSQDGSESSTGDAVPEVLARARTRIAQLHSFESSLIGFNLNVTSAVDALQRVDTLKVQIDASAGELSKTNELLQHEAIELDRTRESLKEALAPFDELDRLVDRLGLTPGATGLTTLTATADFVDVLEKLTQIEVSFHEHPEYRDSAAALKSCTQLRKRSLAMAKSQVTDALNQAVRAALGKPTDKLESSMVYTKFSSVADSANKIIALIQRYANDEDTVLDECRQLYCSQRLALLKPVVSNFFAVRPIVSSESIPSSPTYLTACALFASVYGTTGRFVVSRCHGRCATRQCVFGTRLSP